MTRVVSPTQGLFKKEDHADVVNKSINLGRVGLHIIDLAHNNYTCGGISPMHCLTGL